MASPERAPRPASQEQPKKPKQKEELEKPISGESEVKPSKGQDLKESEPSVVVDQEALTEPDESEAKTGKKEPSVEIQDTWLKIPAAETVGNMAEQLKEMEGKGYEEMKKEELRKPFMKGVEDERTYNMRINELEDELVGEIKGMWEAYLKEHPDATTEQILKDTAEITGLDDLPLDKEQVSELRKRLEDEQSAEEIAELRKGIQKDKVEKPPETPKLETSTESKAETEKEKEMQKQEEEGDVLDKAIEALPDNKAGDEKITEGVKETRKEQTGMEQQPTQEWQQRVIEDLKEEGITSQEHVRDLQEAWSWTRENADQIQDPELKSWVESDDASWDTFLQAEPKGFFGKVKNFFSGKSKREKMWDKMAEAWEQALPRKADFGATREKMAERQAEHDTKTKQTGRGKIGG